MSKLKSREAGHPMREKPTAGAKEGITMHTATGPPTAPWRRQQGHQNGVPSASASRSNKTCGNSSSRSSTPQSSSGEMDSLKPPTDGTRLESSLERADVLAPLRSVQYRWTCDHVHRADAQRPCKLQQPYMATSQNRARILRQNGGKNLEYMHGRGERRPSPLDENIGSSPFAAKLYSERGLSRYAWAAPEYILRNTHGFSNFIEYELHLKAAKRCQMNKEASVRRLKRPSRILDSSTFTRAPGKWANLRRAQQNPLQGPKQKRKGASRVERSAGARDAVLAAAQATSNGARRREFATQNQTRSRHTRGHTTRAPTAAASSCAPRLTLTLPGSDENDYYGTLRDEPNTGIKLKPKESPRAGQSCSKKSPPNSCIDLRKAAEGCADASEISIRAGSISVFDDNGSSKSSFNLAPHDMHSEALEESLSRLGLGD